MQSTLAPLCEYKYDALDRLIKQHQPDAPTHQCFYCKSRLATEIHGTLRHSILQHGDMLLAEQRRGGSSADTTLLATDLHRSVLNTVTQGIAPQPNAYSPYGHRPALGGLLSLLGFNGERPDPLTGHYLLGNGYRAFNPVLMRLNSPDSWSPFGKGGLNCYAYCSGDPINHMDPSGHSFSPFITKSIKAWMSRAKANLILKPNSGRLPTPPRVKLSNEKIISLAERYAHNKKQFAKLHDMQNNLIKKDIESALMPSLESRSIDAIKRNNISTATLLPSIQELVEIPSIPKDVGPLFKYLQESKNGLFDTLQHARSRESFITRSSQITSAKSIDLYARRITSQTNLFHVTILNENIRISAELRGR